jgi:hypothetical protein
MQLEEITWYLDRETQLKWSHPSGKNGLELTENTKS